MLFLRRRDLCECIQRWLSLPSIASQGTRNSWETGLPQLVQLPVSSSTPPPKTHSRSYYLHRNRGQMAKETRKYKRSRIPTWTESTIRPGTASRAQPEELGLGLKSLRRLEYAFLSQKSSSPRSGLVTRSTPERLSLVREMSPHSNPQVPPRSRNKTGSRNRTPGQGFVSAASHKNHHGPRSELRARKGWDLRATAGLERNPSPGAARVRSPVQGEEGRSR